MSTEVDWYYHRSGCTTCRRAMAFMTDHEIRIREQVIANKNRLGPEAALRLAGEVDRVVVMRGRKRIEFDMRNARPQDEELLKVMLGPTGNLRAPTVRRGRTLLVGFDSGAYGDAL
jgi:arsenate reductase-like glutaredoxin family protein